MSASSDIPTHTIHSTTAVAWEGKHPEDQLLFNRFTVDYDYFETFNIEILQGRAFSKEFLTDKTEAYILNETGIKMTGIESPIGKMFALWGIKGKIIGVVKDYHFKSLHADIEPLVLRMAGSNEFVFIRIKSENIFETIKDIEQIYKKFNPNYPFEFNFLGEAVDNLYQAEKRTGTIFRYFMFLAICVARNEKLASGIFLPNQYCLVFIFAGGAAFPFYRSANGRFSIDQSSDFQSDEGLKI